jgi:putative transposase
LFKIKDVVDEEISELQEKELIHLLFQGKLEFEFAENNAEKGYYHRADFHQISDNLKAEVHRKQHYIEDILSQNLDKYTFESLTPIIKQVSLVIQDKKTPSYITVYRWLKDYENSGSDIRSLIPRYSLRGNYLSKVEPEVKNIIDEVIEETYLTRNKTHIANVYHTVIARIYHENIRRKSVGIAALELPHRSTIYRLIHQINPYAKNINRHGYRAASKLHDPTGCDSRTTRVLERVEIDHTKLPFFVVDEQTRMPIGTPSLTSAVDKYSGVIVGYYLSFEPFSSL